MCALAVPSKNILMADFPCPLIRQLHYVNQLLHGVSSILQSLPASRARLAAHISKQRNLYSSGTDLGGRHTPRRHPSSSPAAALCGWPGSGLWPAVGHWCPSL